MLADERGKIVDAGRGLHVESARGVAINVRNLVVAELEFEFSVVAEGGEVTLIAIERAGGLEREIVACVKDVVEVDVHRSNIKAVADVLILVELGGFQGRIERQFGAAIDVAGGETDAKFDAAIVRVFVLRKKALR